MLAPSFCVTLFSRPAIANDCPSRSSTSVSARRVMSAGHAEALERNAVVEVERADLRTDLQANDVACNRRPEIQPDAELLEDDRDRAGGALHDRHRELAAREEARFLAVVGDQVRLGKRLEEALLLERLDDGAEAFLAVEEEEVQKIAEEQAAVLLIVEVGRRELLRGHAAGHVRHD